MSFKQFLNKKQNMMNESDSIKLRTKWEGKAKKFAEEISNIVIKEIEKKPDFMVTYIDARLKGNPVISNLTDIEEFPRIISIIFLEDADLYDPAFSEYADDDYYEVYNEKNEKSWEKFASDRAKWGELILGKCESKIKETFKKYDIDVKNVDYKSSHIGASMYVETK